MDDFVADAIFIDAPPERVHEALVEPEEVLEWLDGDEARIAPGAGGEYVVARASGGALEARIAEFSPPARLVLDECYRTTEDGVRRGPSRVTFTLEPHDGGVWITVREDGLDIASPAAIEALTAIRREWVRATVTLKRLIEQI